MDKYILAEANGRVIPERDVIFGISGMAKEMAQKEGKDKVFNGTVGSLLDDDGNLMILSSVVKAISYLKPEDYADYAPIGGLPSFQEATIKDVFGSYSVKGFTRAVATPGGSGAIRNTIVNYSKQGDGILTTDWFWGPYHTIAQEHGRTIETFALFTENNTFNFDAFKEKLSFLIEKQEKVVILLNTPAHNPTGFTVSDDEWDKIIKIMEDGVKDKGSIILFVDCAYLDYAGDPILVRRFLQKLDGLNERILTVIGYSMSKGYTLYGMRGGAMICLSKSLEVAEEFKKVSEQSCRGTWSNCTRAAQVLLSNVHKDEKLMKEIQEERASFRAILLSRGEAFEEEAKKAGLTTTPYSGGFFISVPCDNSNKVADALMEEGVFIVPMAKGLRIAVSSLSVEKLKKMPGIIKKAIDKVNK